jgi:hypothetical protein
MLTWKGHDDEAATPSLVKSSIWTNASCHVDTELGLVRLEEERRVGDVDCAVERLHAALVRLAVGQRHFGKHHIPARGRLGEHIGVVHQDVRAPLVGHAVVLAPDRVPRRVVQPGVDLAPARHQVDVHLLHPAAGDQPQAGVARGSHEIESTLIHQRDHLVRGVGRLDTHLASGFRLVVSHPIEGGIGIAALYIAGPGDDIDDALKSRGRARRPQPRPASISRSSGLLPETQFETYFWWR